MKELFTVLVEFEDETSVGGVFESEQLAKDYVSTLSSEELDDDLMNDYVEVDEGMYVLIQKNYLNEHDIII